MGTNKREALSTSIAGNRPGTPTAPEVVTGITPAEGLWIGGSLTSRKRRQVTVKGGKTRWIVTLVLIADNEIYKLDRWCDSPSPSDCPKVGEQVSLKIRQRVFTSNGQTRVSLEWGPAGSEDDF